MKPFLEKPMPQIEQSVYMSSLKTIKNACRNCIVTSTWNEDPVQAAKDIDQCMENHAKASLSIEKKYQEQLEAKG